MTLAPVLLALAFVLNVYVDSGEVLETLPRPLAIAAGLAAGLQVLGTVLLRSVPRGAVAAVLALVSLVHPIGLVLLVAAGLISRILTRRGRLNVPVGVVGVPIALLFAVSTVRVVTGPAFDIRDLTNPTAATSTRSDLPDIFTVLLDAYPRTDTLAGFGYDNTWFEVQLAARGFDVAPRSRSNYAWTYLVLPTTFHMAHADEIASLSPPPGSRTEQRRAIREAMSHTPATARMREAGYRVVSAGLPGSSLTLRDVDEYRGDASITIFEHQVLERMLIGRIMEPIVLSAYRDRTLNTFDQIEEVADEPASTFMFAHVLSPHVPFVFDRDGGMPQPQCSPSCNRYRLRADESGMDTQEFNTAYANQVHYINGRMLAVIDTILEKSPDAVIVLFSDHGSRSSRDVADEWYSTLFAARTPGHPNLYGPEPRSIEIFPRLFGAYFDDEVVIPPDTSFQSPYRNQLPLTTEPWPSRVP